MQTRFLPTNRITAAVATLTAGLLSLHAGAALGAVIDVNPGNVGDAVLSPSYDVTNDLIAGIGQPGGGQTFDVDFVFTDGKTLTSSNGAPFTWSLVLTYSDIDLNVPVDPVISVIDANGNSVRDGIGETFLPGPDAITYSGFFSALATTFSGVRFSFVATDFAGALPLLNARLSVSSDLPLQVGQAQIGVPEPTSMALFGLGLVGLLGGATTRRRAHCASLR
ncbi:MAG: PEP-CTERM sorting domain-containing protein [Pseudomonadota bacterium]